MPQRCIYEGPATGLYDSGSFDRLIRGGTFGRVRVMNTADEGEVRYRLPMHDGSEVRHAQTGEYVVVTIFSRTIQELTSVENKIKERQL